MEFDEARKCIAHLVSTDDNDAEVNKKASMIVSSLSTIIQLAGFTEQLVKNDDRFGNFHLGIYASALQPSESAQSSEKKKLFTLFGPNIETGDTMRPTEKTEKQDEQRRNGNEQASNDVIAITENEEARLGIPKLTTGCMEKVESGCNSLSTTTEQGCVVIPESIVAKCMSYIYDFSGYTTHQSSFKVKDIDSINAKAAVKAVKELFREYKEFMKERGLNTHGMQYGSMIPEHLRNKDVLFPNLILTRSGSGKCYRKESLLKIKLPVHKADRNKKTENLAIMACFIHHSGHGVSVENVLRKFARKGYGLEGCKNFQKCSAVKLMISCRDKPQNVCAFYGNLNSEHLAVARGSVDPFATYICGEEIPESSMLVRMSEIHVPHMLGARDDDMNEDEFKRLPRVWPKKDISRAKILGEHGPEDVIGDGIIVAGDFVRSQNNTLDSMSICNAILLCDCTLRADKEKEPYPFSEWYSNRLLRQIAHVLGPVPQEMGDVLKEKGKIMIWHKARVCAS